MESNPNTKNEAKLKTKKETKPAAKKEADVGSKNEAKIGVILKYHLTSTLMSIYHSKLEKKITLKSSKNGMFYCINVVKCFTKLDLHSR